MDSITHISIGACIGELFFEKGFGKKAMLWGALAQTLPDIDFATNLWLSPPDALLAHRGFTHSFLFVGLISPILALIADKIHQPKKITFLRWVLFFGVEGMLHLFLDVFNNYGIGWLEPFSHYRFSFNMLYVLDPFFSFFPIGAFLFLLLKKKFNTKRGQIATIGITIPAFYICFCLINKLNIQNKLARYCDKNNIHYLEKYTTPAPMQNWLWYTVLKVDNGFLIGYISLFDPLKKITFHFIGSQENEITPVLAHEEYQKLIRFSQGFYTIEIKNGQVVFNDLRFGQIFGWKNSNNDFVFHYFLRHDANSSLLIQQGRLKGWNFNQFISYWSRVFNY